MRLAGWPRQAMTTAARRVLAGCAFAALAALAAACGLQRAPHSIGFHPGHGRDAANSPRALGTPTAAGAPCLISQFKIRLDAGSAGVAAGTSYLPIDFTNAGSARCVLAGFPQVTIAAGSTGKQVGAAATVDRRLAPTAIVLAASQDNGTDVLTVEPFRPGTAQPGNAQ